MTDNNKSIIMEKDIFYRSSETNLPARKFITETKNTKKVSQENLCSTQSVCSTDKEFVDIIYMSGTDSFFLLKENAFNKIQAASKDFHKNVLSLNDSDKMLNALVQDKYNLKYAFLSPMCTNFLEEKDKAEWTRINDEVQSKQDELASLYSEKNEIEKKLKDIDSNNKACYKQKTCNNTPLDFVLEARPFVADLETVEQKINILYGQIKKIESGRNALKSKIKENAKKLKYTVNDQFTEFYDNSETEVIKLINKYKTLKRLTYVKGLDGDKLKKIRKYTEDCASRYKEVEKLRKDNINGLKDVSSFEKAFMLNNLAQAKFNCYSYSDYSFLNQISKLEQIETIVKLLAVHGIILPEYVLGQLDGSKGKTGSEVFADWIKLQLDITETTDNVKSIIAKFDSYITPPNIVFEPIVQQLKNLQKQSSELKKDAQNWVSEHYKHGMLLWDPETYQPKPVDTIINSDYPLREFISASIYKNLSKNSANPYSYLSLYSLNGYRGPSPAADLNDMVGDPSFVKYFKSDVLVLELEKNKDDWFDKNGEFVFNNFKKFLNDNGYKIRNINQSWAEAIKKYVIRKELRFWLNTVDERAPAQLARVLVYSKYKIEGSKKITHSLIEFVESKPLTSISSEHEKTFKNNKFSEKNNGVINKKKDDFGKVKENKISGELKGDINFFQGEVNYDYFSPEKITDNHVVIPLKGQNNKKIDFDVGCWQFHFQAKAWGRASASLSLSGEVKVDVDSHNKLRLVAPNVDNKDEDPKNASTGLFLGLEVGIRTMAEIMWAPPEEIVTANQIDKQISVGSIAGSVVGSIEFKYDIPFYIRYLRGKFYIRFNPSSPSVGVTYKIGFEYEINFQAFAILGDMYLKLLRKNNFANLQVMDDESFKKFGFLGGLAILIGVNIVEVVALGMDEFDKIKNKIFASENAGLIAYSLSGHLVDPKTDNVVPYQPNSTIEIKLYHWFKQLVPEMVARLLNLMLSSSNKLTMEKPSVNISRLSVKMMQHLTIMRFISWLYKIDPNCSANKTSSSQNFLEEAIIRMTDDYSNYKDKKQLLAMNLGRLDGYMDRKIAKQDDRNYILWFNDFKKTRSSLLSHIELTTEPYKELYSVHYSAAKRGD